MKQIIKDLCPPLVWRKLQDIRSLVRPHQVRTSGESQDQVEQRWQFFRVHFQFLMANVEGRVLDIACGTGKTMTLLDRAKLEIMGCDISDQLIEKAIERGLPAESLDVCDATKLPYEANEFDYSYSIGSLEHFTEEGIGKFIDEASRVTRVGSFHMMPTSRSGKDEGWMKTYQSFHNCSPSWWVNRFEKHFKRVRVLDSNWNDQISVGKWFLCYH